MDKSNSYILIIGLTLFLMAQGCSPDAPTPTPTHTALSIPMSTETTTPMPISTPMSKEEREQIRDVYLAAIDPFLDEWEEVNQLATDRGRGWIGHIIRLQEIRNGFAQLEIDPVSEYLHSQMILHMDCQIAAYVALISPRDYSSVELLDEPEVIFERCSFPVTE